MILCRGPRIVNLMRALNSVSWIRNQKGDTGRRSTSATRSPRSIQQHIVTIDYRFGAWYYCGDLWYRPQRHACSARYMETTHGKTFIY